MMLIKRNFVMSLQLGDLVLHGVDTFRWISQKCRSFCWRNVNMVCLMSLSSMTFISGNFLKWLSLIYF